MKLHTAVIRSILVSSVIFLPFTSLAADNKNQPPGVLKNGVEVFSIGCTGMPQETTLDINACMEKQVAQVTWVKNKYLSAASGTIEDDENYPYSDPTYIHRLTTAFNEENKAWNSLIDKASSASYTYWEGGSIRTEKSLSREKELIEFQVYDIWKNWLTYADSTPPVLPEPEFMDTAGQ
ncbi:hypothetical protein CBH50_004572 [Salmonella enterica subsp. diarizonae serovar 60:r:e,n,x,z15]|nr:hypothetical protein [Salmonella enterica subsp. diarizonae serovar 60:r:e,n,x,z15]